MKQKERDEDEVGVERRFSLPNVVKAPNISFTRFENELFSLVQHQQQPFNQKKTPSATCFSPAHSLSSQSSPSLFPRLKNHHTFSITNNKKKNDCPSSTDPSHPPILHRRLRNPTGSTLHHICLPFKPLHPRRRHIRFKNQNHLFN